MQAGTDVRPGRAPGRQAAGAAGARAGFTLLELLVASVVLALLAVALRQVIGASVSSFGAAAAREELLANGRFAMERMAFFARETDRLTVSASNDLWMVERALDVYHNDRHTYEAGGDGRPDADNDANGRINDNVSLDRREWVNFRHDAARNVLLESLPDYGTGYLDDRTDETVIGEHVRDVVFSLPASNLLQIDMTLQDGETELVLRTRVRARAIVQ